MPYTNMHHLSPPLGGKVVHVVGAGSFRVMHPDFQVYVLRFDDPLSGPPNEGSGFDPGGAKMRPLFRAGGFMGKGGPHSGRLHSLRLGALE